MIKRIIISMFMILIACLIYCQEAEQMTRDQMIEDIRQLSDIFETVHPDPYIKGGGKIAFHRRLHELISSIPENGLSRVDFGWMLQEFTGRMQDSHSRIRVPLNFNDNKPGGIPIYFNVIEDMLYTYGYITKFFDPPFGSVLLSVEGVKINEIKRRYGDLLGIQNNKYNVLANLRSALWNDVWIARILPEWKERGKILIELKHPDGGVKKYSLTIPSNIEYPLHTTKSKVVMPSARKCDFEYKFLDNTKETALLVINSMVSYREAFEIWHSLGRSSLIQQFKGAYKRAKGINPPDDVEDIIAGIPSATETFLSLLKEMKSAETKNLIIDLRRNDGGSSTMANILIYLIYGEEKLLSVNSKGREVKKLSQHYFKLHSKESVDTVNKGKKIPLIINDYIFIEDKYGWNMDMTVKIREITKNNWQSRILQMPTFKTIYDAGEFNGYFTPENIVVISSSSTFSSGFTLMEKFYRAGALVVGRPSGQEPNAFGSWQEFTLNNSKIVGYVSHKRFYSFPEDSELASVLKPHHELTYDKFKSYNFDKNADILFALEILSNIK